MFRTLYEKVIIWSKHRHAVYWLSGVSFAESSFFPIPPDVMLITMTLAKRQRAFWYALIATVFSVLGGLFGYLIGMFCYDLIYPYVVAFGYQNAYQQVETWFEQMGFLIMFVAGFSPVPYKIFTIAAGASHLHLVPFILASLASRGARFLLVSAAIYWQGERIDKHIRPYIDRIGWFILLPIFAIYFLLKVFI